MPCRHRCHCGGDVATSAGRRLVRLRTEAQVVVPDRHRCCGPTPRGPNHLECMCTTSGGFVGQTLPAGAVETALVCIADARGLAL